MQRPCTSHGTLASRGKLLSHNATALLTWLPALVHTTHNGCTLSVSMHMHVRPPDAAQLLGTSISPPATPPGPASLGLQARCLGGERTANRVYSMREVEAMDSTVRARCSFPQRSSRVRCSASSDVSCTPGTKRVVRARDGQEGEALLQKVCSWNGQQTSCTYD